jgi:hypothetical protein
MWVLIVVLIGIAVVAAAIALVMRARSRRGKVLIEPEREFSKPRETAQTRLPSASEGSEQAGEGRP